MSVILYTRRELYAFCSLFIEIKTGTVTFRLPRLFLDDFFSPSFGVLLVAAFPRMKFCGKIRNKNNEKRNIYGSYVVFYFFILFN
jgi:hypothetical protein